MRPCPDIPSLGVRIPAVNRHRAGRRTKAVRKSGGRKPKKSASRSIDKAAERKAALACERKQKRRDLERAREEAARQKERESRQQAVDNAQAALDKAEREHEKRAAAIHAEVEALEKKLQAEDARWHKEKDRLDAAVRRAALVIPSPPDALTAAMPNRNLVSGIFGAACLNRAERIHREFRQ
jgi:hypothetical protein